MKKWITFLVIILLLPACQDKQTEKPKTKNIPFAEEGDMVVLSLYSASQEYYLDHFPEKITITYDGTLTLHTEEVRDKHRDKIKIIVNEDAPTVEKQLSDHEMEKLQALFKKHQFLTMQHDVTDYGVMDGSGSKITLYTKEGEYTVGGDNSSYEPYNEIKKEIFSHVKNDYQEWFEKTEAYIYRLNED